MQERTTCCTWNNNHPAKSTRYSVRAGRGRGAAVYGDGKGKHNKNSRHQMVKIGPTRWSMFRHGNSPNRETPNDSRRDLLRSFAFQPPLKSPSLQADKNNKINPRRMENTAKAHGVSSRRSHPIQPSHHSITSGGTEHNTENTTSTLCPQGKT